MVSIYKQGRITNMTEQTKADAALKEAEALATKGKTEKPAPKKAEPKGDKAAPKKVEKTKAELEAEAAAKKAAAAKAEAEKLAKQAEKDAEKAKKEGEAERFKKVTEAALEKDAKEINIRFEKAEQMAGKADDMRLAAAIMLADAKERCREAKISFQEWAEKNIKQSYETVRKLIPIGVAENKEEGTGKLLLADMRNKNAETNRKHRAEAKANGLLVKIEAVVTEAGDKATGLGTLNKAKASLKSAMDNEQTTLEVLTDKVQAASEAYTEFKKANGIGKRPELTPEQRAAHAGANGAPATSTKPKHDLERVEEVVASCAKDIRQNVVKTVAEANGFRCITEDESKKFASLKKHDELSSRDKMEQLFARMTGKEQAAFAEWAAAQVGGTFTPKAA